MGADDKDSTLERVTGKIKAGVGDVTGRDGLKLKGQKEQVEADAKDLEADTSDRER